VNWFALSLAPAAWLVAHGLGYPLVKRVCATGDTSLLLMLSVMALLMTAAGILLGATSWLSLSGVATDDGARTIDRRYFAAQLAIGFNAVMALLIATTSLSQGAAGGCQ
jgi:hypothetical protein